ncbi:SDR family NAD(P)-dependent oxidoreductase [Candidatus Pelagibacter sp.]|nr:SDR family NAD(P)-dependent oxidoreductase [Candidatus Pelagibacter sp.]
MKFNFKNKNVFISGGTHGIGLSCCLEFLKLNANIITFSRDSKKIKLLKAKIKNFKSKNMIEKGDVLDKVFLKDFSKKIKSKYKRIDILIHNVGGGGGWGKDSFLKTEDKVWDEVYAKNINGLVYFTKAFLPSMIKNKWGRVIAISSVCGSEVKEVDRTWYNAAKASQNSIIKSFSKKKYFTKKNITFNCISPGPILIEGASWHKMQIKENKKFKQFLKNKIFVNRMGKVEDISSMCIFLSSNYSNYINGSNIIIDGGFSDRI